MPKFECLVVRETYTSLIVEVEAVDADAAYEKVKALDHEKLFEDNPPTFSEYSVEDVLSLEAE